MRRIKTKLPSNELVISHCCEGIIKDTYLKSRLENAKSSFQELAEEYKKAASSQNLYSLKSYIKKVGNDPIVTSGLLHSELTGIYKSFFVGKDKPARKIYDEIMANALGKCPYCDIGIPEQLDHYLPKKHYPQFSITPVNLVPSCLDCNMGGKGSGFATVQGEQILHPYLDEDFYFDEQWISARFVKEGNEDIVVEYFLDPPSNWKSFQRKRVETHFNSLKLKKRFSELAGEELSISLLQISNMEKIGLDSNDVCEVLINPIINSQLPSNHWRKVMYVAAKDYLNSK